MVRTAPVSCDEYHADPIAIAAFGARLFPPGGSPAAVGVVVKVWSDYREAIASKLLS